MQGSLFQEADDTPSLLQPLLTIPAVAKMLHVSRPTVYALIDAEGLPIIKLGRSVRISPISLQKWLAQHEQ
ncbi:MAG TPA: helix-turn-helix domain-containing protein [Ktedonobacteraceae bacterium]|nr:helix-turn-helix domain-containing protein [Ktedonobacteraceae bacterium]